MSTKISKKKFVEMLRTLIRQEIDEVSTTATAGGAYDTPRAFSGKGKMDRRDSVASGSGYEKIDEVKFAVTIDMGKLGDGKVLVDAGSKGAAITMVAKKLKQGRNGIKSVSRVQPSLGKQVDKKIESVNEGKYHDWRNDESLTPRQKIGRSMREVKNSLTQLSKMIDMNVRLKNELSVDSSSYWKTTHKALNNISERLVKLANKVGKLQ
tara:strand:- start:2114 stop:2740 length:627 start_codon:yes stop_codon:yes gene_type:complete